MSSREPLHGTVLDEQITLTIQEVCEVCGVEETIVIEMIEEGIAEPVDPRARALEFSGLAARRLLTAFRLQRDLHVNLAGAALALDLLDEIESLRGLMPK